MQRPKESVWDYPRPPRVEPTPRHLRIELDGVVVAETRRGVRVLETSHPPVYYFPPEDVRADCLQAVPQASFCEWKGRARYFDVVVGDILPRGARGDRIPRAPIGVRPRPTDPQWQWPADIAGGKSVHRMKGWLF